MNKFYNASVMSAQDEARRYARRELEEKAITDKYASVDMEQIAAKCRAREEERVKSENAANQKKKKK